VFEVEPYIVLFVSIYIACVTIFYEFENPVFNLTIEQTPQFFICGIPIGILGWECFAYTDDR